MIRILLVDDQKMVRETLKVSLEPEIDFQVVGTANDGVSAIEQVEALKPDIVVMNMQMPILDGASATKTITSRFPLTKVLMLTSCENDEYITKSLAMGAKGYLLKNANSQDIAGAIRNVHKGYTQISPGLIEKLLVYTDSGVILSRLATPEVDSEVILSKLRTPETISRDTNIHPSKQIGLKPPRRVSSLQYVYRQQQEEIIKLRESLQENKQELPKIKRNLSSNSKSLWLIGILWLLSFAAVSWSLFQLYNKAESIQTGLIPIERVGLKGEFSLNGIAERVAKSFMKDSSLAEISTVYIAQEDDAIILTGIIPNATLLRRMENVAKQVPGVKKVYTSQVAIQQGPKEEVLGSKK